MTTTSDIRPLSPPSAAQAAQHEHAWLSESRHRTSEGQVLYVRCGTCHAWRIDLQRWFDAPPIPLSRPTGG